MILLKNLIFLKSIQINFSSYVKQYKNYNFIITNFKTKRLILNRAPKHFNIGQHQLKVRTYNGYYLYNFNYFCKGLTPHKILLSLFYKEINLSKKLTIKSSKIFYCVIFKF